MRISDWSSDVCSSDLGNRLAHDIGLADHDGPLAPEVGHHALKKDHAAHRRAGHEASRTRREPTDIDGMKAIHVLRWVYGVEHFRAVDLLGKRQLNQNAMYGRVGVELCYQREEFSLGDRKSNRLNSSHYCASRMPYSAWTKKHNSTYYIK